MAEGQSPAAFTTDVDGEAVNKNQYAAKCDVYLNGGPSGAQLAAGSYVFFVLAPSGQNNPNDADTLLSSDGNANRTFSVLSNGSVRYSGTHERSTDENGRTLIQLCNFADTPNPGGVYIVAICKADDISPRGCKYDAFKVRAAGTPPVGTDLVATKTAAGAFTRTFPWQVSKSVDRTYVQTSGNTATFNYTVSATKGAGVDSGYTVSGQVQVFNLNDEAVSGVSVTDQIGAVACAVSGGSTTIAAGGSATFSYTCSLGDAAMAGTNTATVTWDQASINSPTNSANATAPFDFTAAPTLVNNCTTVTDTFGLSGSTGTTTPLGSPCATQTFTYARTITLPTSGCATYDNLAQESASGTSAGASVRVCRTNSGGFTIGYWSNKNGQAQIKNNAPGLCPYLAQFSSVLSLLPASCDATSLSRYVLEVINAANSSGDGVAMYRAQFLATALNAYFSSALANTRVVVPTTVHPSGCMTVAGLLTHGNTEFGTLSADKAVLLTVKDIYDNINNNNQVTC